MLFCSIANLKLRPPICLVFIPQCFGDWMKHWMMQMMLLCVCLLDCRVVSSALKCFHDLTEKIESGHCGTDGAAEYRRSYIQPVVDQSRDTVTAKCTLAPPYDRDYVSSSAPPLPMSLDSVLLAWLSATVTVAWHRPDILRTAL